jgi:CubicO group peptidase (beta-lactamase class C family)
LSHTSGIPNPIPLRWVHPVARHATFDEGAALTATMAAHPKPAFAPGAKYAYSNIGYWLLGKVVERASGESFTSYVTSHIFGPLGISPSEMGYAIPDAASHAKGYLEKYSFMNLFKGFLIDGELIGDYEGRWLRIEPHYLNGPAVGGLVGTARGFGKFLEDQLRGHSVLLDDTTRAQLYDQQQTTQGTAIAMTLGWHIGQLGETRFYYFKEGGGGGFHCEMRLYPAAGIGTVVMTNATGFKVKRLLNNLDSEFLQ